MSITDSYEPVRVPPVGAVPQAPGGFVKDIDPSEPLRLLSRSGDTAVVFRLDRRLPFLRRLGERAMEGLDRLADHRRVLIAAGAGLLAVGALATMMGGAYRKHPSPHEPAPAAVVAPTVVPIEATPAAAVPDAPAPAVLQHGAPRAKPVAHRTAHAKKPHAKSAAR